MAVQPTASRGQAMMTCIRLDLAPAPPPPSWWAIQQLTFLSNSHSFFFASSFIALYTSLLGDIVIDGRRRGGGRVGADPAEWPRARQAAKVADKIGGTHMLTQPLPKNHTHTRT